jgi:hypothetical protein
MYENTIQCVFIESQIANATLGRELHSRPSRVIPGRQYNCRPNYCGYNNLKLTSRPR